MNFILWILILNFNSIFSRKKDKLSVQMVKIVKILHLYQIKNIEKNLQKENVLHL